MILEKDEPTTTSSSKFTKKPEESSDYDVWTEPLESKQCIASMSRSSKTVNEAGKFPEVSRLKFMQQPWLQIYAGNSLC